MAREENSESEMRWIAPEKQQLYWEDWGELCAVYDSRSGDTHLLAEPTARLLQQLVLHSATTREIGRLMGGVSDASGEARSLETAARILQQLHSAGLIEKACT